MEDRMVLVNNDLPCRLTGVSSHFDTCSPPGAKAVKYVRNRNTEWYCSDCLKFIFPIWIRQAGTVFPVCEVCFYEQRLKEACGDVEILGELPKAIAVDNDLAA
jgi:hypothetical protein